MLERRLGVVRAVDVHLQAVLVRCHRGTHCYEHHALVHKPQVSACQHRGQRVNQTRTRRAEFALARYPPQRGRFILKLWGGCVAAQVEVVRVQA